MQQFEKVSEHPELHQLAISDWLLPCLALLDLFTLRHFFLLTVLEVFPVLNNRPSLQFFFQPSAPRFFSPAFPGCPVSVSRSSPLFLTPRLRDASSFFTVLFFYVVVSLYRQNPTLALLSRRPQCLLLRFFPSLSGLVSWRYWIAATLFGLGPVFARKHFSLSFFLLFFAISTSFAAPVLLVVRSVRPRPRSVGPDD